MIALSDTRGLWCIRLALTAISLVTTPCEAGQVQNGPSEEREIEVLALEAPRVRVILEQAANAEAGRGQRTNLELAAVRYCEAASYGSLEAQYRLGRMILAGRGMPRDVSMAATLFSIAADNGHQAAKAMLLLTGEHEPQLPRCLSDVRAGAQSDPIPKSDEPGLKLSTHLSTVIH